MDDAHLQEQLQDIDDLLHGLVEITNAQDLDSLPNSTRGVGEYGHGLAQSNAGFTGAANLQSSLSPAFA